MLNPKNHRHSSSKTVAAVALCLLLSIVPVASVTIRLNPQGVTLWRSKKVNGKTTYIQLEEKFQNVWNEFYATEVQQFEAGEFKSPKTGKLYYKFRVPDVLRAVFPKKPKVKSLFVDKNHEAVSTRMESTDEKIKRAEEKSKAKSPRAVLNQQCKNVDIPVQVHKPPSQEIRRPNVTEKIEFGGPPNLGASNSQEMRASKNKYNKVLELSEEEESPVRKSSQNSQSSIVARGLADSNEDVAAVLKIFDSSILSHRFIESKQKFVKLKERHKLAGIAAAESAMLFLKEKTKNRNSEYPAYNKAMTISKQLSEYYKTLPAEWLNREMQPSRRRLMNGHTGSKTRWRRLKGLRPIHRLYNEILDANGL